MSATTNLEGYDSAFATKLRELLEKHPITYERTSATALGKVLDVKQQTVSQWMLGNSTPELKYVIKIAEYFRISIDELVTGVSYENKNLHMDTGLTEDVINMLKQFNSSDVAVNTHYIEFLNEVIISPQMLELSRAAVAYVLDAHLDHLEWEKYPPIKEDKKFKKLPSLFRPDYEIDDLIPESPKHFEIHDYETYKLMRNFEHLIERLLRVKSFRRRVEKALEDKKISYGDYVRERSRRKREEVKIGSGFTEYSESPITYTLSQFYKK